MFDTGSVLLAVFSGNVSTDMVSEKTDKVKTGGCRVSDSGFRVQDWYLLTDFHSGANGGCKHTHKPD